MAEINIGGDPADRSYRYKRPRLQTKIEGRGNGIKTVIPNMFDIAKALKIDPAYPTKFFGIELGAQSKYDKATDRAVVNGAHNAGDLETLLHKFIDIFILCPGCQLPEISIKIRKDNIKVDCAACGFNGFLETKHRLTTYILKDRKDAKKLKSKDKDKDKDAASKKKHRRSKKASADAEADGGDGVAKAEPTAADSEVTWFTDTSAEAQEKRKSEELHAMGATGAEDVEKHIQDITRVKTAETSPQEIMRLFLSQDRDLHEITSELRRLELSRNLDETKKIGVLLLALLDLEMPREVPEQLRAAHATLKPFVKTRHEQNMLMANLENIAGVQQPLLLPRIPLLLQVLYETDLVDEDVILEWHAAPLESSWAVDPEVAESLRSYATPFIDWLKNAEESDEDDEDDEV